MTYFGIEEEYFLLDRKTLAPVPLGPPAREVIAAGTLPGTVSAEFLTCQVEYSTSPVTALADAGTELRDARAALAGFARANDAIGASSGTPFGTGAPATTSPSARYATISRWLGDLVGEHQVNGTHIHVEIPDAEDRIRAMNALRPWLPVLLSLSANSPYWHESDTNFRSWRSILLRRFPTFGSPPHFQDASHYEATVNRLIDSGGVPDAASLSWMARISERFPTVEVRVFDAQLTVDDALLLASLTRALLLSAPSPTAPIDTDTIDTSLWIAAREGLDARLTHPLSGGVTAARALVRLLLRMLAPALQANGDLDFVEDRLMRTLRDGTGADRQRAAFDANGIDGLRSLLVGQERASAA
ncbi:carboxylate-amine ligase [Microbacterium murale]|uniref:Putative glutamate--cysteine ligase 2 n=1 Tax=Microbacterium murale TaxID=1081040 RepID=A0ABU0P8D2_9MICO|nr:YbdK family carboxylate-amine ligase [Microbacterium murale]MDQ0643589.1 carboxylate-amine ligase [Microbacterium murale]